MHKKVVLISIMISLILLSITLNIIYRQYTEKTIHLHIVMGKYGKHDDLITYFKLIASYDIEVYRHGELVTIRHKDNDPITINWYKALANFLLLGTDSGQLFTWYDTSHNTHTAINTEFAKGLNGPYYYTNPITYIVLGNGTGTPTSNDYKLFNEVTSDIAIITVDNDVTNKRYIVTFTITFLISHEFNLTEIGLELLVNVNLGDGINNVKLLICHDIVQPSITLYPNDAISITYRVYIPYNTSGVFTKWFYNAIINYMLGYKGTMGTPLTLKFESGNTGSIDTAQDTFILASGTYDKVKDYELIEVGNSTFLVNPEWEVYSLCNIIASVPITDTTHFTVIKNTNNSLSITYIAVYTFTTSVDISEIGILLHTDRSSLDTSNITTISTSENEPSTTDNLLLAYWTLTNPINVEAYSGLRIEITVTIPYS